MQQRFFIFLLLLIIILWAKNPLNAQQLPVYSQFMQNLFLINPAVAGSDGYTTINIADREQWIGFPEGRPSTRSVNIQARLMKTRFNIYSRGRGGSKYRSGRSGKVGLGGFIFNDVNGPISKTGMIFTYAYHMRIVNTQVSFGLSGSLLQVDLDKEKLVLKNSMDPMLASENQYYVADANFGVYILNYNYFAGFSVSDLLKSAVKFNIGEFGDYKYQRNYNIAAGYTHVLNPTMEFEPSFLIRSSENFDLNADLNFRLIYDRKYWGGLNFRTTGTIGAMVGFKYKRLYLDYAYEIPLNRFITHSFGTHEVLLSLKLGDSARRYRWLIRY